MWATQESPLRRSVILLHYFIGLTDIDIQAELREDESATDIEVIKSELHHKVSKADYAKDTGELKVILTRIEGKLDNWRWTLIIVLGIATLIIGYLLSRLPSLP